MAKDGVRPSFPSSEISTSTIAFTIYKRVGRDVTVSIYHAPGKPAMILDEHGTLEGEQVMPGLRIVVAQLGHAWRRGREGRLGEIHPRGCLALPVYAPGRRGRHGCSAGPQLQDGPEEAHGGRRQLGT